MARLRIRIELNRGGVGVPLHKLASVVEQAQTFLRMLADDVHVDQTKGEWLGFDFDHESLNFTAEFVGPVTPEQVSAFHAAFGGSTSLSRATIAQFARITDAIGEDELIGFGLYLKDQGEEPEEWRCLSRRDALRISEEMQLLAAASGEFDRDTRLPAVAHDSSAARWFSERHERGVEPAKWVSYVREVEASLDRRIGRVEKAIDDQSSLIGDLHLKSAATEDSVRRLLGAVEGFCAQTTRQLEAMSAPAPLTQSLAPPPEPVAMALELVPELVPEPMPEPMLEPMIGPKLEPILESKLESGREPAPIAVEVAAAAAEQPLTEPAPAAGEASETEGQPAWHPVVLPPRSVPPIWAVPIAPMRSPKRDWRLTAGAALLTVGIVFLSVWAWQNLAANDPSAEVTANDAVHATSTQAAPPAQTSQPAPASPSSPVAQPAAQEPGTIRLEASELTWVSVRNAAGNTVLSRLFAPGDEENLDIPNGATLRVGNAGGLNVRFNGQPIGPLGTHGQVRDVVFRNGSYKIGAAE